MQQWRRLSFQDTTSVYESTTMNANTEVTPKKVCRPSVVADLSKGSTDASAANAKEHPERATKRHEKLSMMTSLQERRRNTFPG